MMNIGEHGKINLVYDIKWVFHSNYLIIALSYNPVLIFCCS